MNCADLAQRVRLAYDRCAEFPELGKDAAGNYIVRGDAFLALIELRNMAPDIETAMLSENPSNITP